MELSAEEKHVISTIAEYESEYGRKAGIKPRDLEIESQRTWNQLAPILIELGDNLLIEVHKGSKYKSFWLPFKPNKSDLKLCKTHPGFIVSIRLTEKAYKLIDKIIPKENGIPDDLITLTVAIKKMHVKRRTLMRALEDGRLKSYRDKNAPLNSPHMVSESKVAALWPEKG